MGRCGCEGTCSCSISSEASFLTVTGTGTIADPFVLDTGLDAAWTAWTPTFVNLTVGNGTLSAGYQRVGRAITFYIRFVLGSTSAVGTSPTYTLPVAASSRYSNGTIDVIGQVAIADAGTANIMGVSYWGSTTTGVLQALTAGGTYVGVSSFSATVPMTWVTTDAFVVWGTYEAAT